MLEELEHGRTHLAALQQCRQSMAPCNRKPHEKCDEFVVTMGEMEQTCHIDSVWMVGPRDSSDDSRHMGLAYYICGSKDMMA